MTAAINVPRLVVAGLSSGVGKTTVVVGLARALVRRGLRVSVFKCGPDYLDPTYHARAVGAVAHNLDSWMMGREALLATFASGAAGSDIALIEGVMGLFDGASPRSEAGSTAEIAKWLAAPVVVVVDASGMARTVAAIHQGLTRFDAHLSTVGLVCNRVGGAGHLDLLRSALPGGAIVGGLPRHAEGRFPERHLGLCAADTATVSDSVLDGWGELVEEWFDLDRLIEHARSADSLNASIPRRSVAATRCRLGIAKDEAFHFYYDYNLRLLEENGAELVPISLLRDQLPDVDGLYIGGGYPEVHAEALEQNLTMRSAVRDFARRGGPIYAECGGLMYLARCLRTTAGSEHEMAAVLDLDIQVHERLQALGYVEVQTRTATPLGPAGLRFRGHQFRYSEIARQGAQAATAYGLRRPRRSEISSGGYICGNTLASYVHAHWASNPTAARGFVAACVAFAATQ